MQRLADRLSGVFERGVGVPREWRADRQAGDDARGRSPGLVPVWFVVDGDQVVFTCSSSSVKARSLARDPRAALVVDDEAFPHTFVRVRGTAETAVRPADLRAWTTRIATRYVGAERAEEYGQRNEEVDDCLVRLTPESVLARAEVAL